MVKLRDKIENLRKSEIVKLVYQGTVYGLRVIIYNVNTDVFEYYDFSPKTVKNESFQQFVTMHTFREIPLYLKGSLLITQEELEGKITVREFKDEDEVAKVLNRMMKLYSLLERNE